MTTWIPCCAKKLDWNFSNTSKWTRCVYTWIKMEFPSISNRKQEYKANQNSIYFVVVLLCLLGSVVHRQPVSLVYHFFILVSLPALQFPVLSRLLSFLFSPLSSRTLVFICSSLGLMSSLCSHTPFCCPRLTYQMLGPSEGRPLVKGSTTHPSNIMPLIALDIE